MKKYEKYWFLISFFILLVSGIFYLYFRDVAPMPEDPYSVISSPWQSWMIKIHVLVAPVFIFWVGWVSITHTMNRLKRKIKRGKKTGLINVGLLSFSIITGYLIQVITHESGLVIVSNSHIYISLFCFLMVLVHQVVSEKIKKNNAIKSKK